MRCVSSEATFEIPKANLWQGMLTHLVESVLLPHMVTNDHTK